jgi:hypothetical protein
MQLVFVPIIWVLLFAISTATTPSVLEAVNSMPLLFLLPTPIEIFLWEYAVPTLLTAIYATKIIG